MTASLTRAVVELDGRRVHYRAGGSGPPVLLLHQSPQASSACVPLAELLLADHSVVLPDTPGFGMSTPLPGDDAPTIQRFADALAEFCEALALPPAAVVGTHTGAQIALEFALRHPQRVTQVIFDGLPLFNAAEREEILSAYLHPFVPHWDGSHLTWLWMRLREQTIFFPWFKTALAARLDYSLPGPEVLHEWVMDFMYAGNGYRGGYGAAFTYTGSEAVAALTMPATCLYREREPLATHAERLPPLPDNVELVHSEFALDATRERIAALLRSGRGAGANWAPASAVLAPAPVQQFISAGPTQLACRYLDGPPDITVLALHDTGSASERLLERWGALAGHARMLVPDLPGHGESAPIPGSSDPIAFQVTALGALLDAAGLERCVVLGSGSSSALAAELARAEPERVAGLILHGPFLLPAERRLELAQRYAPAVAPDPTGNYLHALWQALRDDRLFWPWFEPWRENIRWREPQVDPEEIHAALFDVLRVGQDYARLTREAFDYDVVPVLAELAVPVQISADQDQPWCGDLEAALPAGHGYDVAVELDDAALEARAAALLQQLTR